jgi:hypothetical protein
MLKQQWTIEEISIFSNSSHLEWRAGLSDTILKGTHPGTILARFGIVTTERPSSVVRPSVRPLTFHILINSSETTGPI